MIQDKKIIIFSSFLISETREDTTELLDVVDSGTSIQKNTTKSKIKFLPSSEDDKARYVCEARHPALVRPQQVTVHLSVQCKIYLELSYETII